MTSRHPAYGAARSLALSAVSVGLFLIVRVALAERAAWLVCWPAPVVQLWVVVTAILFAAERLADTVAPGRVDDGRSTGALFVFTLGSVLVLAALMPDFDVDALAWTGDRRWRMATAVGGALALGAAALCATVGVRRQAMRRTMLAAAVVLALTGVFAAAMTASGRVAPRAGQVAYAVVVVPVWLALVAYGARAPAAYRFGWRTVAAAASLAAAVPLVLHLTLHGRVLHAAAHPDVFLITVDTLRADSTTRVPNLGRLAAEGIVFDAAYSQAPWTQSSLASLLTSRYPSAAGFGRAAVEPFGYMTTGRMDPSTPALPSILAGSGYATLAVLTNSLLTSRYGFDQGFARVSHVSQGYGYRSFALCATTLLAHRLADRTWLPNQAVGMTELALREIDHLHAGGRPVLAWIHYIDPHGPYAAPGSPLHFSSEQLDVHRHERPADERARAIRDAYEDEVRYVDGWIGHLLDGLRARGLYDDALIVMTADHGEEFWEHGSVGHGNALHEEQLHVPLIVKLPGAAHAGTRRDEPVGLVAVLPTILAVAGVQAPGAIVGRSLVSPAVSADADDASPVFSEALMGDARGIVYEQKAARTRTHAIVDTPGLGTRAVYDRRVDRAEQQPQADAAACPELASSLDAWSASMLAFRPAAPGDDRPSTSIDAQRRRQLKALGYID